MAQDFRNYDLIIARETLTFKALKSIGANSNNLFCNKNSKNSFSLEFKWDNAESNSAVAPEIDISQTFFE